MKRIGSISLNINTDDLNYGAMLHSWAFQQFLLRYDNVSTEIIDYKGPTIEVMDLKYPTITYIKQHKPYLVLMSLLRYYSHARRYDKFRKFVSEHCIVSDTAYTQSSIENAELSYDTIVCESDVIWAPGVTQDGYDRVFFLKCKSMEKMRKVAYAASLANAEIMPDQEKQLSELVKGIDAISCRETYAASLIERISSAPVQCVVDPVLLLDGDDYNSLITSNRIEEPYALLYMPIQYNFSIVKRVRKFAKTHGLRVIEISQYPFDIIYHKTVRDAGIEEFLTLIKNADVVFSNSFHAVCFSIIFKKEFFAFSRRTGRKIEDICSRLDLNDRFIKDEIIESSPINYDKVDAILKTMVEQSISFIEKSIINE